MLQRFFHHPFWVDFSLLLSRVSLGLFFLLAGWQKMTGGGIGAFVNGPFKSLQPAWLPDSVATPFGYCLPPAELILGLALALGLFSRISALLICGLLVAFTVALIEKLGVTGGSNAGSFHFNLILAPLALVLATVGPGKLALDPLYFKSGPPGK